MKNQSKENRNVYMNKLLNSNLLKVLYNWMISTTDVIIVFFLKYLRRKEASLEWWSQRIFSGLLIPLLLLVLVIGISSLSCREGSIMNFLSVLVDIPTMIIGLTTLILAWHIQHGMCEIITDYVHRERIKLMSIFMVRVTVLQCIKFVYVTCVLFS